MYMRLIGYPADKIAILTTYNGQKHLIRDVIRQRCANNPLIGQPSKVIQTPLESTLKEYRSLSDLKLQWLIFSQWNNVPIRKETRAKD